MNLAKNLEATALFFPDRPAISEDMSIVDDFPKSPAGKILKRELRKSLEKS